MSKDDSSAKDQKREAKKLRASATKAFAAGDYRSARALDKQVIATAPDSDFAAQARDELERLKIDPAGLYVAGGSAALLIGGWILSIY